MMRDLQYCTGEAGAYHPEIWHRDNVCPYCDERGLRLGLAAERNRVRIQAMHAISGLKEIAPVTPLPWQQDSGPGPLGHDLSRFVYSGDRKNGEDVCECLNADEDAAYIVQACNAYPALLSRLAVIADGRDTLKTDETGLPGWTK